MIEHGWVAWVCSGFLWWPLRNLPQWMPNLALILFNPLRSELWNDWQSWLSMAELHGCAVVFCDDHFEIYHNECQIWHWFYLTHLDLNCEMIGNHDWAWVRRMGVHWLSVMTTSKFTTMNAKIWHWFYLTHLDLNCEMSGNHDSAWVRCMVLQWFSVMTTSKFTTMNAKFGIDSIWPT